VPRADIVDTAGHPYQKLGNRIIVASGPLRRVIKGAGGGGALLADGVAVRTGSRDHPPPPPAPISAYDDTSANVPDGAGGLARL
jgi:hypothetical protein